MTSRSEKSGKSGGTETREMRDLADRTCVPCRKGTPPLEPAAAARLLGQLEEGWELAGGHLVRELRFRDFAGALSFVNRVGAIAEAEGHHPDLHLSWGRARVEIWTHSIDGLSEADFVLAAKIDRGERA